MPDYTYGKRNGNLPIDNTFLKAISGLPQKTVAPTPQIRSTQAPNLAPALGTQPTNEEQLLANAFGPIRGQGIQSAQQPQLAGPSQYIAPTSTDNGRGFFGDVFQGLKNGLSAFGQAISSPGGRQATAQLAENLGRGNPLLEGAAKFASNLARQEQYERIKDATMKGLSLSPTDTAGLDPGEIEGVRQSALAEQQRKIEQQRQKLMQNEQLLRSTQERSQSEAQTQLLQAQTQKTLQEPTFAERQAAELQQRSISAGVQTFPSGPDQAKSFIFDPQAPGGIRVLGQGSKTQGGSEGAISTYQQAQLDRQEYEGALDEAAKRGAIELPSDLITDPQTGRPTLKLKNPAQDAPKYEALKRQYVAQKTQGGLIKNPAYYKALTFGIPYEFDGGIFTGEVREGKPIYQKLDPKTNKMMLYPLEQ